MQVCLRPGLGQVEDKDSAKADGVMTLVYDDEEGAKDKCMSSKPGRKERRLVKKEVEEGRKRVLASGIDYHKDFAPAHKHKVPTGHWPAFLQACASAGDSDCEVCQSLLAKMEVKMEAHVLVPGLHSAKPPPNPPPPPPSLSLARLAPLPPPGAGGCSGRCRGGERAFGSAGGLHGASLRAEKGRGHD